MQNGINIKKLRRRCRAKVAAPSNYNVELGNYKLGSQVNDRGRWSVPNYSRNCIAVADLITEKCSQWTIRAGY
jgi:hypothetical protein